MKACFDLTGQKFNRLTVIKFSHTDKHRFNKWECICDCGKKVIANSAQLKSGGTKSCGCYKNELCAKLKQITHGHSKRSGVTAEYRAWCKLKERCNDVNDKRYPDYGGRGIKVCERWLNSFENFFEDMGKKPSPKHSVEREDNDKGYSPGNCVWATKRVQSRNTRRNHWEEYGGERMVIQDWAERLQVDNRLIHSMLKRKSFKEVYEFYLNKKKVA
jgi:hypothetical protein